MKATENIHGVYHTDDQQDLEQKYDAWAASYDQEVADLGYISPRVGVETFVRYVPKTAHILDVGAGTGLVGELLHQHGYTNLVGLDLSSGMLAKARAKQVYTALHQMVLGEPLDLPTDAFDALISIGVFTHGHAPASAFDELVRIAKPGAHIIFALRPELYADADTGFKLKFDALSASERWRLVELEAPYTSQSQGEATVYNQIHVYQAT